MLPLPFVVAWGVCDSTRSLSQSLDGAVLTPSAHPDFQSSIGIASRLSLVPDHVVNHATSQVSKSLLPTTQVFSTTASRAIASITPCLSCQFPSNFISYLAPWRPSGRACTSCTLMSFAPTAFMIIVSSDIPNTSNRHVLNPSVFHKRLERDPCASPAPTHVRVSCQDRPNTKDRRTNSGRSTRHDASTLKYIQPRQRTQRSSSCLLSPV